MIRIHLTTNKGPISGQYKGGGYLDISYGNEWNPTEAVNVYEYASVDEPVERQPEVVLRAMVQWLNENSVHLQITNIYITNTFVL